jgi:hypothetical protein
MDIFKEIRSQYEVELKAEIEFEFEYENLLVIHRRFQAKNILLDNLQTEFERLGRGKFLESCCSAVLRDSSLCSPNYLLISEVSELEKLYSKELMEFNRQFLSRNLGRLENRDMIKFLTESLLINNISKELLISLKVTEPKTNFWNFASVFKK